MKKGQLFLTVVVGLLPVLALMVGLGRADGPALEETALNPSGEPFEINADADGDLWISDNRADEVWQLNPATGVYTVYEGMANVADARQHAGDVWWTGFVGNILGRISLDGNVLTSWSLGAAGNPRGTAVDDAGRVWATDSFADRFYRFDPSTTELCTYTVPDNGASVYVVAAAGAVWLGDWRQDRILKLDPASDLVTAWQLASGSYPGGLAVGEGGDLWWADRNLGVLARLQTEVDRLTTYTVPLGSALRMVALDGGRVWYSEITSATIGALDPGSAKGAASTLITTTMPVTPACGSAGPGTSTAIVTRTGSASWTTVDYATPSDSDGWTVYQLPQFASPWGIATSDGRVWMVDRGRRKLLRLTLEEDYWVYLPLISR